MARRKPRGINGPLHLTADRPSTFVSNELPDEKSAIERRILDLTLKAAEFKQLDLYKLTGAPIHNEENNFDFTLPTTTGVEYLDLVEIVLQGGYDGAPNVIGVGSFADQMFTAVKAKAKKYGMRRRSVIHLLLYSTHWKFLPSESVIALFSLYCHRKRHGFKTVTVMMPIMDESAAMWLCHPAPAIATEAEPLEQQLRSRSLQQFGPMHAQPGPGGSVSWQLKV